MRINRRGRRIIQVDRQIHQVVRGGAGRLPLHHGRGDKALGRAVAPTDVLMAHGIAGGWAFDELRQSDPFQEGKDLSAEIRPPVSYTHLDVYKRQRHSAPGP